MIRTKKQEHKNVKEEGKRAYLEVVNGRVSRNTALTELQEQFGIEGVFAFGQSEFYQKKRSAFKAGSVPLRVVA